jgi:hypothetical protein
MLMLSKQMKREMKVRKAWAKAAQSAEMLVVRVLFGSDSIFSRQNKKEKKQDEDRLSVLESETGRV